MKTLIVCLAILALSVPASATVWYDDGAVHNLTTQTSDSIGIDNATTVNVGGGVTITLNREALYSTTFVGYATTAGPSYLNLTGSGQILFDEEMGLAVSDGSGSSGSISMSGTSYMNPVMLRFGLRGDGIFNITDDAMLEIRGDGVTYPPQFNVGYYTSGHTATINQSGNSIIQSLATGMDFGNSATAIYNMSGGQLILGDAITGPDGDDAFNFSGGTIKMAGDHLPWASERAWFNITGPNAAMWFEEYDVGENVTILGFVGVFGINHSDGATIVNEEGETTDSFSLQLNDPPTDTVTVVLDPPTDDVSLNDEAPNDPITLTFTTADWSVPQTVAVKANDDSDAEGPEDHLLTAALTSGDPYFNAAVGIIKIAVIDNDFAGVVISKSDVTVEEGGADDTYEVVLTFPPTDTVVITALDDREPNQVTLNGVDAPLALTFTTANWSTPQTVTVGAIDDSDAEGSPHNTAVGHTSWSAGDGDYNTLDDLFGIDNVVVTVIENDCDAGGVAGTQTFGLADFNMDCITNLLDVMQMALDYTDCSISVCD